MPEINPPDNLTLVRQLFRGKGTALTAQEVREALGVPMPIAKTLLSNAIAEESRLQGQFAEEEQAAAAAQVKAAEPEKSRDPKLYVRDSSGASYPLVVKSEGKAIVLFEFEDKTLEVNPAK
jgi:RNA 3'-terminal phosphate cyclase